MAANTLSQKVADDLRSQIVDGRLPVGTAIPSQAQLVEAYGVSTSVTRRAVDELRHAGLVTGQPGKAVFVQATPDQVEEERAHNEQLAVRVGRLETEVQALARAGGPAPDLSVLDDLRAEFGTLRRQVATLRGHLIELYGRVGQAYPHNDSEDAGLTNRRAAGDG